MPPDRGIIYILWFYARSDNNSTHTLIEQSGIYCNGQPDPEFVADMQY